MKTFAASALVALVSAGDNLQAAIKVNAKTQMVHTDVKRNTWLTALRKDRKINKKGLTPTMEAMLESYKTIKKLAEEQANKKGMWEGTTKPSESEVDSDKKAGYAGAVEEFTEELEAELEKACTQWKKLGFNAKECKNAQANKELFQWELKSVATWDNLRALNDFYRGDRFAKHTMENLPLEWLGGYYTLQHGKKKEDEKQATHGLKELAPKLNEFVLRKGMLDQDPEDTPTKEKKKLEKTDLKELRARIDYFANTWAAKLPKEDFNTLKKEMEKIWEGTKTIVVQNAAAKEVQAMQHYLKLKPFSVAVNEYQTPSSGGSKAEPTPKVETPETEKPKEGEEKKDDDSNCGMWLLIGGLIVLVGATAVVGFCCFCKGSDNDEL